jgi:hypothetical protein
MKSRSGILSPYLLRQGRRGDEMTLMQCIILLQFTTTFALGQLARQNEPPSAPKQPDAMVRSLYREVVARHPVGIPGDADMKIFAPYLSKALLHRIDLAIACSADEARQHPDPNLKPEIAWLEAGLFSGDAEQTSPRTSHIEGTQQERDGSFRVYVRLTWGSPSNPWIWRVAVIVVRENGHFVVDDVIYLKDENRDVESRLSEYLSAGCDGPRWVGRGKQQVDLEELASLLKQGAVGKVKLLHLHDSTSTRVDVSKEALHAIANYTLDFSDQIAEEFGPLLSGVSVKKEDHTPDLRWGVFFYDAQGREIGSLFVDKFGQYGYVNDQTVSFEAGAFEPSLAKRLHKITGIRD